MNTNQHHEFRKVYLPEAANLSIHCCYIISTDLDIVLWVIVELDWPKAQLACIFQCNKNNCFLDCGEWEADHMCNKTNPKFNPIY